MSEDKLELNDELLEKTSGGVAGIIQATEILFKTCKRCQDKVLISDLTSHMRMKHQITAPVQGTDYI